VDSSIINEELNAACVAISGMIGINSLLVGSLSAVLSFLALWTGNYFAEFFIKRNATNKATVLGEFYWIAIGIEQLKKLPSFLEKRRKNAETLTEKLSGLKQLVLPIEPRGCRSSWYLYTARIRKGVAKDRDMVIQELKKKGVGAAVYYHTPIHLMPYYCKQGNYSLPETEKAAQQVFSLPVHPGLKAAEVSYVAKSVTQVLK
jgi:hypothetical protein